MSIHIQCDFPGCQAAGTLRIEMITKVTWFVAAIPFIGNFFAISNLLTSDKTSTQYVAHLCADHAKEIFREGRK